MESKTELICKQTSYHDFLLSCVLFLFLLFKKSFLFPSNPGLFFCFSIRFLCFHSSWLFFFFASCLLIVYMITHSLILPSATMQDHPSFSHHLLYSSQNPTSSSPLLSTLHHTAFRLPCRSLLTPASWCTLASSAPSSTAGECPSSPSDEDLCQPRQFRGSYRIECCVRAWLQKVLWNNIIDRRSGSRFNRCGSFNGLFVRFNFLLFGKRLLLCLGSFSLLTLFLCILFSTVLFQKLNLIAESLA